MAEHKTSYDNTRQRIADIVPLDAPLSMYVEPTRICNFRCFYCMHNTRGQKGGQLEKLGYRLEHMDMGLFEKLVEEVMSFPTQPKRICFSGLGEPLTNKHLPDMIRMLRKAGFTGRVDVITNASLLTYEMSDALIEAGISRLQVSIQGLTSEKYREVSGVAVSFDTIVDQVRYFYENKKQATIFVKIIDDILENKEEEEQFYKIFGDICDTIYIEHLVIMQQQMGDHHGKTDGTRNLNGEYVERRQVCGVMFYFLQVNIDGETFPCSTPGLPVCLSMGNMREESLNDIWNGKRRNKLIRQNLISGYATIDGCGKDCSSVIAIADKSEYMDDCREEVLLKFPEK